MTVQLQKELRTLYPAWFAALGLVALPVVMSLAQDHPSELWNADATWMVFLFIGGVLMGTELFGREFSQKTFQMLLAAPVARTGIWRRKLQALAILGAVVFAVEVVLLAVKILSGPAAPSQFLLELAASQVPFPTLLLGGALSMLVVLACGAASGLFWILLTRQSNGAFWLALATPGLLAVILDTLGTWTGFTNAATWSWRITLPALAVGAYLGARALFQRAQDLGLPQIDLFGWLQTRPRRTGRLDASAGSSAGRTPTRTMIRKELALQQFNFVLVLILGIIFVLAFASTALPGRDPVDQNRYFQYVTMLWFVLWPCVPLAVGAAAYAEERRLGLDTWQAVLPISATRQWLIKLAVTWTVSLTLGVLLPLLCELAFVAFNPTAARELNGFALTHVLLGVAGTAVGFYASSLSRTLVQALSGTIALSLGIVGLVALAGDLAWKWWQLTGRSQVYGSANASLLVIVVAFAVGWPLLTVLTRWNHLGPQLRPEIIRHNISALALGVLLILALPIALMDRSWERLIPEPKAGAPLPARNEVKAAISGDNPRFLQVVLTPDGSLWGSWGDLGYLSSTVPTNQFGLIRASLGFERLHQNRNWVSVATTGYAGYFINADGSMWRLGHPGAFYFKWSRTAGKPWWATDEEESGWSTGRPILQRWEVGGPWQEVAAGHDHAVALKRDGTLWTWGGNRFGQLGRGDLDQTATPVQIGDRNDWRVIAADGGSTVAADAQGQVWKWGGYAKHKWRRELRVAPEIMTSGTHWIELHVSDPSSFGIQDDGTVRSLQTGEIWSRQPWRAAAFLGGRGYLVDSAGSLRRVWSAGTIPYTLASELFADQAAFTRIGSRKDWVALGSGYIGDTYAVCGLTADGVLWRWDQVDASERPFLRSLGIPPSSRPRPFANLSSTDQE